MPDIRIFVPRNPTSKSVWSSNNEQDQKEKTMKSVSFGLGTMGLPMAGHVAKRRHMLCYKSFIWKKPKSGAKKHTARSPNTPALARFKTATFFLTCCG